jgi:hypothetical protein
MANRGPLAGPAFTHNHGFWTECGLPVAIIGCFLFTIKDGVFFHHRGHFVPCWETFFRKRKTGRFFSAPEDFSGRFILDTMDYTFWTECSLLYR